MFTEANIKKGFEKTGVVPFNQDATKLSDLVPSLEHSLRVVLPIAVLEKFYFFLSMSGVLGEILLRRELGRMIQVSLGMVGWRSAARTWIRRNHIHFKV